MEEIFNQLVALANKFNQNKKLSKIDSESAKEKLQMLLMSPEYADRACRLLPDLPNPCCQAVADAWRASGREHRTTIVQLLLDKASMAGTAVFYRKISLVVAFIPVDTQVALRLLVDLAGELTHNGTKAPTKPLIGRFWNELMKTKKLLMIPLEENDISNRDISGIAAMVLLGMINSSEQDITLITDYINWLDRCHNRAILGTSLITDAEKVTKKWPEDLQLRCQNLGLINTVSFQIPPNRIEKNDCNESKAQEVNMPAQPENGGGTSTEISTHIHGINSEPVKKTRELEPDFPKKLNAQICFDWLAQYISSLEKDNELLNKKLDVLKEECYRERMRGNEYRERLAVAQAEQKRQENMIRDLQDRIMGLEKDKRELLNSLQEESLARVKEVEHLKNQIDRECAYVIDEFRNKLLDRLSRYYREYVDACERPSSKELADHLKFVFDRVFRELINQGINFDGDK